MSKDFLVDLGANPTARRMIARLGLPIPLPQKLKRVRGPWDEFPVKDQPVVVGRQPKGELDKWLAKIMVNAGAAAYVVGDEKATAPYKEYGEAYGRLPTSLKADEVPEKVKPAALIFDATGMKDPADLKNVYDFFHRRLRGLKRCGRALVIGRPADKAKTAAEAAACKGLEGFTRSMARELGRKGSTAQVIFVDKGAEARLEPIVRFFLSPGSAYVSGQPLHVTKQVASDEGYPTTRSMAGKVALVTGGAMGIGAETAKAMAREGAHVIVVDRPSEDKYASRLVQEIRGSLLLCDITDPEAANKIKALLAEKFQGNLDILVHNAGITRDKMLVNMDESRWDMALDVNLLSIIRVTEALESSLSDGARVVCLSSVTGIAGNAGQTNYSASKAGIVGYVQAQAAAFAKRGIAINAVAPGFIETRLTARMPVPTREVARRICSLSQGGKPQDVAEVVTFLSTAGAAGLTGECVRVCGGSLLGA